MQPAESIYHNSNDRKEATDLRRRRRVTWEGLEGGGGGGGMKWHNYVLIFTVQNKPAMEE